MKTRLKPIPVVVTGGNAWIYEKAHYPAMMGTGLFQVVGAIPGTSAEAVKRYLNRYPKMRESVVSHEPDRVIPELANEHGSRLVVLNTAITPAHLNVLTHVFQECGVENVISDKPLVESCGELEQLAAAMNGSADGGICGVTFNHSQAPAILQLKHIVKSLGKNLAGVRLRGSFWQYWVQVQQTFNWRFTKSGGVKDLGCHVTHGLRTIAGSRVTAISNGRLAKTGAHQWDILDTGSCVLHMENGLACEADFTQVKSGNADNVFFVLSLPDGPTYMFRLELGADALWKSRPGIKDPDPLDLAHWDLHLRGFSPEFTSDEVKLIDISPPGHVLGWADLMRLYYFAYAGRYYISRGEATRDDLLSAMQLPFATLHEDGFETVGHVDAWIRSAENDGARIELPI